MEQETLSAAVTRLSVLIECRFGETHLAWASGFVLTDGANSFLVTNRHVVTGRHQESGEVLHRQGGLPDNLQVRLFPRGPSIPLELVDGLGRLAWFEHPVGGPNYDIAGLHFQVRLNMFHLGEITRSIALGQAETVSVVGYPAGALGANDEAIWATGFLASSIDATYAGLPVFLIDCRTCPGQSGAPVWAYRPDLVRTLDGGMITNGRPHAEFLGLYSGRIREGTDIGMVWKAATVREMCVAAVQ